jgi:hypothetical protein
MLGTPPEEGGNSLWLPPSFYCEKTLKHRASEFWFDNPSPDDNTRFMRGWTQCFIRQHLPGVPRISLEQYMAWFWEYRKWFKHRKMIRSWPEKKISLSPAASRSKCRDYQQTALNAGWYRVSTFWVNDGWPKRKDRGAFEGTPEELCWHIGKGPKWEAWKKIPYEPSNPR